MEGKKRYLQYTGKKYEPIVGDLSNYDKAYLRKEVAHYKQEFKDAEQQIELLKIEIEQLKNKIERKDNQIKSDNQAILVLKNILAQLGFGEDKLIDLFQKVYKEMFGDC